MGKTVLVTGAARGIGRTIAERFAREGASLIIIDAPSAASGGYAAASEHDLNEAAAAIERAGGRVLAARADVRDQAALDRVVADGVTVFGAIDVVVANAAINTAGRVWELTEEQWSDTLEVNLSGVWRTVKASVPSMIAGGAGGSIVFVNSVGGLRGSPFIGAYIASKHGGVGLMRTLALELAQYAIRVNSVHPSGVAAPMGLAFGPKVRELYAQFPNTAVQNGHALAVSRLDADDVAAAVLWLASDESRYLTGVTLPVDAGFML